MQDLLMEEEKSFVEVPKDVLKENVSSREDLIQLLVNKCMLPLPQASFTSLTQPESRSGS